MWTRVCRADEVQDGQLTEMDINGMSIIVARTGYHIFAIPPLCPHMEQPLAAGILDGTTLTCIKHLWQWDVRTGETLGEAEKGLKMYPVKLDDDDVYVALGKELTYDYED